MENERVLVDAVPPTGLVDEVRGQEVRFALSDGPRDDVPAEDVDDDIQVIARAVDHAPELRNIPAPDHVASGRKEFRGLIRGMPELIAALPHLAMTRKDTVIRA